MKHREAPPNVQGESPPDGASEPLVSRLMENGFAHTVVDIGNLQHKKMCLDSDHLGEARMVETSSQPLKNCSKFGDKFRSLKGRRFYNAVFIVFVLGYAIYLAFVVAFDTSIAYWTIIDLTVLFLLVLHRFLGIRKALNCVVTPLTSFCRRNCHLKRNRQVMAGRIFTAVLCIGLIVYLIIDLHTEPRRLIPLGGLALFMVAMFITSKAPSKVKWRPVVWGVLMQFVMGIIILRWPTGYMICKYLGDGVAAFLNFTDFGSKFVFGEKTYTMHAVVFKILPVVVYFSAVVSILYYLGVMQAVVKGLAKLFQFAMNTTAIESFATAVHIFIGQVISTVALKPFLRDLTLSELNAVMTSGFATVAGTVIAAYIEFGVPAEHVITASFMSAPASLAISKLNWPETEEPIGDEKDVYGNLDVGNEHNIMEAASAGAVTAIKLIAYVVVNLIAFISLLAFLDYFLSFMGSRVGHPEVTFQFICSYVFMPLAFVMGVPWEECDKVAMLIGKKIFINEFLSYADLGQMVENNELGDRAIVIATYILCGFGSVAAMGINLGAFTAAEPSRRRDFASGMLRAMIGGNVACFMTACVAGILYQDGMFSQLVPSSNQTLSAVNSTLPSNFSSIADMSAVFNGSIVTSGNNTL